MVFIAVSVAVLVTLSLANDRGVQPEIEGVEIGSLYTRSTPRIHIVHQGLLHVLPGRPHMGTWLTPTHLRA